MFHEGSLPVSVYFIEARVTSVDQHFKPTKTHSFSEVLLVALNSI